MRLLAAGLAVALLAGCREAPADADPIHAPPPQPGVDVREAALWLDLDADALRIGARAMLTVAHPDTLSTLALGLDAGLDVRTVRVDGAPVEVRRDGDALRIPLAVGDTLSVVEVVYRGTPAAGLYAGTWEGRRAIYTDGWPDRTAGWLPAVHHPSDPLRVDLTLVVPAAMQVVATGERVAESVDGGRRTVRVRLASRARSGADGTPPYTVAWAAGAFAVAGRDTTASGVPVAHWLLDASLAPQMARTAAALDTLAAILGPYPFGSYATVQVPMAYAGMENAGAAFLRADLYTTDAPGRNAIEEVNFHELAHQWWGDAVVPADWRDLWLAEGPATYLTAELYARLDGADAGRRHLVRLTREIAPADADRALVPSAYADPADVLSPTVYQKGASVLHLLRLTVGDDAFWRAMRSVQTDFATRPLSTAAFRSAFEQASGRSLDALFQRWVFDAGRPRLVTRWDRASRTLAWEVEGDGGTLDGVPFLLYVRQGDDARWIPALDGVATLPGTARPTVEPVGLLLDVR